MVQILMVIGGKNEEPLSPPDPIGSNNNNSRQIFV